MTRSTARTMSTTFAGGSLRSGVAMSWVTLTPTPGPRSRPVRLAAGAEGGCGIGLGSAGGEAGLGGLSGVLSRLSAFTLCPGKNLQRPDTLARPVGRRRPTLQRVMLITDSRVHNHCD